MVATISSSMRASLMALTTANTDAALAQSNLNTGKVDISQLGAVNYVKAQSLSGKADTLSSLAKSYSLAKTNVDLTQTALNGMSDSLKTLTSALKDARGSAVASTAVGAKAVSTVGGRSFVSDGTEFAANRKTGTARATAAEVTAVGGTATLGSVAANKRLLGAAAAAATNTDAGSIGLGAIPAGLDNSYDVGWSLNVNGTTYSGFVNGTQDPVTGAARATAAAPTVGDLVKNINAKMSAAGVPVGSQVKAVIDDSTGSFNLVGDSGAVIRFGVGVGVDSTTAIASAASGTSNAGLGLVATDATVGFFNPMTAQVSITPPGGAATLYGNATFAAGAGATYSTDDISMIGNSADQFQNGDVFTISATDKTTGNVTTKFFQATSTRAATNGQTAAGQDGNGAATAFKFTSVGDFMRSIRSAFSNGEIMVDKATNNTALNTAALPSTSLKMWSVDTKWDLTFAQVTNAAPTVNSVAQLNDPNQLQLKNLVSQPKANGTAYTATSAGVDFGAIFGQMNSTNMTTGAAITKSSSVTTAVANTTNLNFGNDTLAINNELTTATFGSTGAFAGTTASSKRTNAVDTFNKTMGQLDSFFRQAKLTGGANLLNAGEKITLRLDDTTNSFDIQLTTGLNKVDSVGLGFLKTGAAYNDVSTNFAADTDIDTTLNRVETAQNSVADYLEKLVSQSGFVTSQQNYLKSVSSTLSNASNDITAADSTTESVNLAAAQTRQQFALSNLSSTKQNEQGLVQLLR